MSFRTIRDPYDPISALRSPVYDEEELERDERSRMMSLRADGSCPSLGARYPSGRKDCCLLRASRAIWRIKCVRKRRPSLRRECSCMRVNLFLKRAVLRFWFVPSTVRKGDDWVRGPHPPIFPPTARSRMSRMLSFDGHTHVVQEQIRRIRNNVPGRN